MNALPVFVVLLSVVLGPIYANACCFPAQWEGGNTMFIPATNLYIRSNVSMDITNQRLASASVIRFGQQSYHMNAIVDWRAKKRYYIYKLGDNRVCRVHPITKALPARPNCLPAGFRPLGGYRIGVGNAALNVSAFGLFTNSYKNVIRVLPGCIPFRDSVMFTKSYLKVFTKQIYASASWYDITGGIRNASVFVVPPECRKQENFNVMQHLSGLQVPSHLTAQFRRHLFSSVKQLEADYLNNMNPMTPYSEIGSLQSSMTKIVRQALGHLKALRSSTERLQRGIFSSF